MVDPAAPAGNPKQIKFRDLTFAGSDDKWHGFKRDVRAALLQAGQHPDIIKEGTGDHATQMAVLGWQEMNLKDLLDSVDIEDAKCAYRAWQLLLHRFDGGDDSNAVRLNREALDPMRPEEKAEDTYNRMTAGATSLEEKDQALPESTRVIHWETGLRSEYHAAALTGRTLARFSEVL